MICMNLRKSVIQRREHIIEGEWLAEPSCRKRRKAVLYRRKLFLKEIDGSVFRIPVFQPNTCLIQSERCSITVPLLDALIRNHVNVILCDESQQEIKATVKDKRLVCILRPFLVLVLSGIQAMISMLP